MPEKNKQKSKATPKKHPVIKLIIHVLLLAVFSGAFAIFLTWLIQFRADGGPSDILSVFQNDSPLFWYEVIAIFALTVLLMAVLGRPFIASGMLFAAALFATYANEQKIYSRGEPLLVDDIMMLGQTNGLLQLVDFGEFLHLALAAALAVVLGFVLNRVARIIWPYNKNYGYLRRHLIAPRGIIAVMGICGIAMILQPFTQKGDHNGDTVKIFNQETAFNQWDPTLNYKVNGFIIGFIYSAAKMPVVVPDNYSDNAVAQIAKQYQREKDQDKERKDINDVVDNVVVVLSESFYDPSLLNDYYPHRGGEVAPVLRKITQEYPSGYMYSPEYGGGTANVEFEVFTGLSNYWNNTVPYMNLIPKLSIVPSVATFTKNNGFDTKVLHSFNSGFYNRSVAVKRQGFDQFIAADKMNSKKHDGGSGYINDWSAYYEALELLRNNENSQTIALITMQNHMPHDAAQYQQLDYMPYDNNVLIGQYYQGLHSADTYLGYFLDALDSFSEKTAVLWFGDHSGGVFPDFKDSEDKSIRDLIQLTPYFVYTNFKLDENVELDLPTVSPNCLVNEMYNVLNVKKPAFDYLLDDVCKEMPILAKPYYSENAPEETETYKKYELVNYDLLSGKQYWLKHVDEY